MGFYRIDAGADHLRVVAHDLDRVTGRQQLAHGFDELLHCVRHGHGVLAGLFANVEDHRRHAVAARHGFGFSLAVFDACDVIQAHDAPTDLPHDDLAEFGDGAHAATDA